MTNFPAEDMSPAHFFHCKGGINGSKLEGDEDVQLRVRTRFIFIIYVKKLNKPISTPYEQGFKDICDTQKEILSFRVITVLLSLGPLRRD